jgi:hypothetical protein
VQRNKRDLSQQLEAASNESIVETDNGDENNGGEVMDSAEILDQADSHFSNESSHTRNKTYFYPKFVSMKNYLISF